jgi:type IV pilus assembly protein PilO
VSRTDRNILILGLLIIVLVVVGYYFLLLRPLLGTLDARAQERSAKESELASLQQEVAQLEAAKRNAPETERQLLELAKRVPTQPEIPTLVVQIEDVADASGVSQLSIEPGTPGPPPGGGNFSVVPVTMSFEGTYEQLQDFLLRTRNLARLVTVNSVTYCRVVPLGVGESACTIEEVPAAGETTTLPEIEEELQVEVEAEVYFQPSVEPSNVPAGTPPVAPAPPEGTTPEETTDAQ